MGKNINKLDSSARTQLLMIYILLRLLIYKVGGFFRVTK